MTDLATAQAALDEAQRRAEDAAMNARNARAHAEGLAARLATGDTTVTAQELADARSAAEHAELVAQGAAAGIDDLHDAVRRAEADETCETVARTLRHLGADFHAALGAVVDALDPLVAATFAFDAFTKGRRAYLADIAAPSERFRAATRTRPWPAVDGVELADARGPAQLAAAILPALRALGAPTYVVDELKTLAAGATSIPGAAR